MKGKTEDRCSRKLWGAYNPCFAANKRIAGSIQLEIAFF
jgi:hypothetical protein